MTLWMAETLRSWRGTLRRPGFLVIASTVLALGVGASAAVLTLIDNVLLKPLPYTDASRLVVIGPMEDGAARHATAEQYRHLDGLDGLASRGIFMNLPTLTNIAGNGVPEAVPTTRIDRGILPALGIKPAMGRNFSAQEDAPNGPRVVMLTYAFWQRRFAGETNIIGRNLQVEGVSHAVIAVLPPHVGFPGQSGDIVLPLALPDVSTDGSNYVIIGRLQPHATAKALSSRVDTRLRAAYAARGDRFWLRRHYGATDLTTWLHSDSRPVLLLFMASAALLLLIAMVNLTNLMLLRLLSRSHDIAVRSALGAPALRMALPVIAEGVLVGVIGSASGMILASLCMSTLQKLVPPDWLPGGSLAVGPLTWLLAIASGVMLAMAASVIGLGRGRGVPDIDALREGGRLGAGRAGGRLAWVLVTVQVSMATVLLSAAGLFLHTIHDLAQVPMGFTTRGVMTLEFSPVKTMYPDSASVQDLARRLRERIGLIPGVIGTAFTTNLPAGDTLGQFNLSMATPLVQDFSEQYRGIAPGLFRMFEIPILEGRDINDGDRQGGTPVGVVSRAFAERYLGGHALGALVTGAGGWSVRVVGVVGDTRQMGPQDVPAAILYVPMTQVPDAMLAIFRGFEPMRIAVQVHGDPDSYADPIRAAFADIAPMQPVANLRSMERIVHDTTSDVRGNLMIIGIFALLALILASTGLYAVMAVAVAAREREFGVRLALGSPRHRLLALVLRRGLLQVGAGLACGLVITLAFSGLLRTLLTEMERSTVDPVAFAGVCALLTISGLVACLPPAWRASHIPPMRALRGE
jgi:predicted permease